MRSDQAKVHSHLSLGSEHFAVEEEAQAGSSFLDAANGFGV